MVSVTGLLLIYGTLDMPMYGDIMSPAQTHPDIAQRFIHESPHEVGIQNMVTSVLASYRGYDTLGEVVVVFCAGIGVLTMLGLKRREPDADTLTDELTDQGNEGDAGGEVAQRAGQSGSVQRSRRG